MVSKVLLSKGEKTSWQTPLNLWNDLNHKFNFTLDAYTEVDNPLATPKFDNHDNTNLSVLLLPIHNGRRKEINRPQGFREPGEGIE